MTKRPALTATDRAVIYSPTTARVFSFCQKKYYFTWLARRKQGWRKDRDHPWHRVYDLKQLKSRHTWAGDLYHEIVAHILNDARTGHKLDEDAARRLIGDVAAAQFAFSAERRFIGATKSRVDKCGGISTFLALFEHAYDLPVDGFLEATQFNVDQWLLHTFAWEGWKLLIDRVRSAQRVYIEPDNLLYLCAGARIRARMDVGIETQEGHFALYDWKCYNEDKRFAEYDQRLFKQQLLAYALWPVSRAEMRLGIDRVAAHVFNPIIGEEREIHFTENDCADFELNVDRWVRLQREIFTEVGEVEFDELRGPYDPQRSCPWCSFKSVCGQEILWHELT